MIKVSNVVKVHGSTFEFTNTDLENLLNTLRRNEMVIVGETHGVKQNYDVYRFLIQRLGLKNVGIELPADNFNYLNNLSPESREDPLLRLKIHSSIVDMNFADGRVSESLLHFLIDLDKRGVRYFFYDIYSYDNLKSDEENAKLRDQAMAANILQNEPPSAMTLVIAGSYHTNTAREHSMASYLKKSGIKSTKIRIEYESGAFYNFGNKLFEASSVSTMKQNQSKNIQLFKKSDDNFTFVVPKAEAVDLI